MTVEYGGLRIDISDNSPISLEFTQHIDGIWDEIKIIYIRIIFMKILPGKKHIFLVVFIQNSNQ